MDAAWKTLFHSLHYGYRTCKWPSLLPRFDSWWQQWSAWSTSNVFQDAHNPIHVWFSNRSVASSTSTRIRRFSTLFTFDSLIVRLLQVRPTRIQKTLFNPIHVWSSNRCFKYVQSVFKDAFQPYSRLILSFVQSFGLGLGLAFVQDHQRTCLSVWCTVWSTIDATPLRRHTTVVKRRKHQNQTKSYQTLGYEIRT